MPKPEINADPGAKAAEQAAAYTPASPYAIRVLTLDDGTPIKVPPHPSLRCLDEDTQLALDQLDLELESYDRHPDIYIPEQKGKDRNGDEITLPAETKPGAVKQPYRKTVNGVAELLNPPYEARVVKLALGDEEYKKLRAGTIDGHRGSAADIIRFWATKDSDRKAREASDSKSESGADVLEDVAAADSERPAKVLPASDS